MCIHAQMQKHMCKRACVHRRMPCSDGSRRFLQATALCPKSQCTGEPTSQGGVWQSQFLENLVVCSFAQLAGRLQQISASRQSGARASMETGGSDVDSEDFCGCGPAGEVGSDVESEGGACSATGGPEQVDSASSDSDPGAEEDIYCVDADSGPEQAGPEPTLKQHPGSDFRFEALRPFDWRPGDEPKCLSEDSYTARFASWTCGCCQDCARRVCTRAFLRRAYGNYRALCDLSADLQDFALHDNLARAKRVGGRRAFECDGATVCKNTLMRLLCLGKGRFARVDAGESDLRKAPGMNKNKQGARGVAPHDLFAFLWRLYKDEAQCSPMATTPSAVPATPAVKSEVKESLEQALGTFCLEGSVVADGLRQSLAVPETLIPKTLPPGPKKEYWALPNSGTS